MLMVLASPPASAATGLLCTIRDPRIPESSGLAASGDSLWTVNDGGSSLRVFELDRSCRVRRVVTAALDPYDVEDLARGRDGTLWLSDTGDNEASRATVAVERLRPDGSASLMRLRYPDGSHDAEALLAGPDGRLFVLTKEPLSSTVYATAAPYAPGRTVPLRKVATLSFGPSGTSGGPVGAASQVLVTGGAVSPSGRLVAVRTYTDAYVWRVPDGDLEAALRSDRRTRIALPATAQGEAVTFAPDGRSLLTSTEGVPGPVHRVDLPADLIAASSSAPPSPPSSAPRSSAPAAAAPATPAGDRSWLPLLGGVAVLLVLVAASVHTTRR